MYAYEVHLKIKLRNEEDDGISRQRNNWIEKGHKNIESFERFTNFVSDKPWTTLDNVALHVYALQSILIVVLAREWNG